MHLRFTGEEVFVYSRTMRLAGVLVIRDTAPSNTIKSKHCNDGAVPMRMNKDAARTRSGPDEAQPVAAESARIMT